MQGKGWENCESTLLSMKNKLIAIILGTNLSKCEEWLFFSGERSVFFLNFYVLQIPYIQSVLFLQYKQK